MTPKFFETAFSCPYCGAYCQQTWYSLRGSPLDVAAVKKHPNNHFEVFKSATRITIEINKAGATYNINGVHLAKCARCGDVTVWLGDKMVYPATKSQHVAHRDMPEDVKADFEEAALIAPHSPRGAAALLRLALEKLCGQLGDPANKTNTNIKMMVENGLSVKVQQALDAVRVIGAEAIHPLTMDLRDDKKTVDVLFGLINLIEQSMITEPKHVQAVYDMLPEDKKAGIENRDKKLDT